MGTIERIRRTDHYCDFCKEVFPRELLQIHKGPSGKTADICEMCKKLTKALATMLEFMGATTCGE